MILLLRIKLSDYEKLKFFSPHNLLNLIILSTAKIYLNLFLEKYLFNPEKSSFTFYPKPTARAYTQIKKINSQAFNFLWNRFYAPALSWMNDNISSSFCIFMIIIICLMLENIRTCFHLTLRVFACLTAALSPPSFCMWMCCLMNTFIQLKSRGVRYTYLKGENSRFFLIDYKIRWSHAHKRAQYSAFIPIDWIIIFIQTHLMPNYLSHD